MKTDDLIRALTADNEHMGTPFTSAIVLTFGAAATAVIFAFWVGPRADFQSALLTVRFPFKVLVISALAIAAAGLMLRAGRPGARLTPWLVPTIFTIGTLAFGAAAELFVLPSNQWLVNWKGTNLTFCLIIIPTLAIVPLIAAVIGLRYGAPSNPVLAGAIAGLAAGAFAATLYALNCNNDSPLFVATWYPIAIGFVVAAGAIGGSRLLRW